MACYLVKYPNGLILKFAENQNRNFVPGEEIIGVDWNCNASSSDNLSDWFTEDGFMLGNAVKTVAKKLGFKHCLSCSQRQQRFNDKGLEIQRKIKDLF